MATRLSTTISRRAALLGGASVAALAGVPAVAVAYENPDAELLRMSDRLDAMMPELARRRDEVRRLWQVWQNHPDMPTRLEEELYLRWWHRTGDKTELDEIRGRQERISREVGHRRASDAAADLWREFFPIFEAMFGLPAKTPAGVLAKLKYARHNMGDGESVFAFFMCPDTSYLDNAIADVERLTKKAGAS